jgi:L1 cell adhesion molecule like protein
LESYAFSLRTTLNDGNLAGKLDTADKTRLESAVDEAIKWLDASQEAAKEEYDDRKRELEAIANPIMQKLYGAGGASGASNPGEGPSVEEVD